MVSLQVAREAIYQRFATEWAATTQYSFDNEEFDPTDGTPWALLYVRHRFSTLECIGGLGNGGFNTFQRVGTVTIRIFVPLDEGVDQADTLAQQARAVFEGVTLSSNAIRFSSVDVREEGPSGGWYSITVEAPFQYDERK